MTDSQSVSLSGALMSSRGRGRALRRGGIDVHLFRTLAGLAKESFQQSIYLRERDLVYFGVEEWPEKWYEGVDRRGEDGKSNPPPDSSPPTEHSTGVEPSPAPSSVPTLETKIGCVLFGGEIPCLYEVTLSRPPPSASSPPPRQVTHGEVQQQVDPSFLALVDFVSQTTGSGVGIKLPFKPDNALTPRDVRTGKRLRYRFIPVSGSIYWVERQETGHGRGTRFISGSHSFHEIK